VRRRWVVSSFGRARRLRWRAEARVQGLRLGFFGRDRGAGRAVVAGSARSGGRGGSLATRSRKHRGRERRERTGRGGVAAEASGGLEESQGARTAGRLAGPLVGLRVGLGLFFFFFFSIFSLKLKYIFK
jgi:hypothetical protein